ncbi:nitrile hydratase accessory protein [Rhizobium oryziradicis]|uniref:Nitrile hydratase accessory protein n=1 Tax=Rhizobium oryziradicis TaxID=1867956 RepID=A0A1Q8ZRJ7_9HYPH|nr:nitrile hydratase accessory protein [Rhizobium oryziradicis]OLP44580.1 nitrile hydratase accessory protein [Rhizobium oryziradicis]
MNQCEAPSVLAHSQGLPKSAEGDPVFAEPWQADAFALTVHLHARGVFTWPEWAEALSAEVHKPDRAEDGSDYFEAWVAALSAVLCSKGVVDAPTLDALHQGWQRAAMATPHGQPILLENDPEYAA